MGRNNAENQRQYRLRKRQDPEWREKERTRVKSYYKPAASLLANELEQRREKIRLATAKSRHRRMIQTALSSTEECDGMKVLHLESSIPTRPRTYSFFCCKYCSCSFGNFSIFKNHVRSHEIIYRKFWATRGNGLTCTCGYVVQGNSLRTHTGCRDWKVARRIRKSRYFAYSHLQPTKITTLFRHITIKPEPPKIASEAFIKYDASHSLPEHECPHCGYGFRKLKNLQMHIKVHTGDTNYKCKVCDRHFVSSTGLKYHEISKHSDEKPFKCDLCGNRFIKYQHMERHKRTHLDEKPFKCKICNRSYITNSNLKVHERTHLGVKQFHCKYCGQAFWQKGHMKDHMLLHGQVPKTTVGKENTCDICNKTFMRKANLVDHYRTHTGERPFVCTHCGQGFTSNALMLRHARMHTGKSQYRCDQCDQGFTAPNNLRRHVMRNHTGVRPYICKTCNKGFAFVSDLRTHEQVHLPDCDKPLKCEICNRGYSVGSKLRMHMKSHSGERPFECEYEDCYKSFATASRRLRHHHTHTGTKNYKCPKCDKAFSQPGNLKRHIRNHNGLKPYKCIFCDYCSAEKGNLKRHVKFKHPPDFTEANIAIMLDLANGDSSAVVTECNTESKNCNTGAAMSNSEKVTDDINSNSVEPVLSKDSRGISQNDVSSDGVEPVMSKASSVISQDDRPIDLRSVVPAVSKDSEGINQNYINSDSVVPVVEKVMGGMSQSDINSNNVVPVLLKASGGTSQSDVNSDNVVPVVLKASGGISQYLPKLIDVQCASSESAMANQTAQINGAKCDENTNWLGGVS